MMIKLDKFEGPFYLLLSLIENEELSITEVSLVKVADQYINYLKTVKEIDPEQVADFLLVAAKLLLIKSRALLPYLYPAEDEEVDDFEAQIKMYREFLLATKQVAELIGQKHWSFARQFNRQTFLTAGRGFFPPKNLSAGDLGEIFQEVIRRLRPAPKLAEATMEAGVSIEEKISHVRELLNKKVNFIFSQIISKAKNRTEVIVGFLAILELMKQREVVIEQTELFGEIEVSRVG